MASTRGRTSEPIVEALEHAPWQFEFFQAVRLLAYRARVQEDAGNTLPAAPVGRAFVPKREFVRFRSVLSRSFPASEITSLKLGDGDPPSAAELEVAFIGLTGPLGVLPEHYFDLLYQQVRDKNNALRDFFEMFNHRTVSLFYRAWEKYRPVPNYERAHRDEGASDPLVHVLESLIGAGTNGLAERLPVADGDILSYAGHFAHAPRSAIVLQTVLADHFGIPVHIEQFIGRWLPLDEADRSRLPGPGAPRGQFNQLGIDAVIGVTVWDEQSKFRLRLGPLTLQQFQRFLPTDAEPKNRHRALVAFVRRYAGIALDFDIDLVLQADDVPLLQLGGTAEPLARLGWNTWLGDGRRQGDRDEPRFQSGAG